MHSKSKWINLKIIIRTKIVTDIFIYIQHIFTEIPIGIRNSYAYYGFIESFS